MRNSRNINPSYGSSLPIPSNRELTISLVGSIIRFVIDVPQVLLRRENISSDKLLFLLLPIVRNLGKLIDRIRHSPSVAGRAASNSSGRPVSTGGSLRPTASDARLPVQPDNGAVLLPPAMEATTTAITSQPWHRTRATSAALNLHRERQHQQQLPSNTTSMVMSDEEDESTIAFGIHPGPMRTVPHRQLLRHRDGNYAIRETTDTRGTDGTFQRITKTISGPDVTILTNITSQLSELPTLMPRAIVEESYGHNEK